MSGIKQKMTGCNLRLTSCQQQTASVPLWEELAQLEEQEQEQEPPLQVLLAPHS